MPTCQFNRQWAALIIESLTRAGIRHVCIAPGSRSSLLAQSAACHPDLHCHTHFDERGLGHLALGIAKTQPGPVAVIVTSGTAVANLYPAVIEAGLTGENLVLLTADRPPELTDCGANQAIMQAGLFHPHAVFSLNLPRPSADIPARWLVSAIDSALGSHPRGAVHINCPFAEPLYGQQDDAPCSWLATLGAWRDETRPWLMSFGELSVIQQPDWLHWRERKGVVIAGQLSAEDGPLVAGWAAELGWPLVGDILSCSGQPLPSADLWLADPQAQACLQQTEIIIQFGGHLTSKRLLNWLTAHNPTQFWLIDPASGRLDPAHHQGRRIQAPVAAWLEKHSVIVHDRWAPSLWARVDAAVRCAEVGTQIYNEAQIAHRLPQLLAHGGQLFIGNSLTVRLADALAQMPAGYPVFANRGASGIDGLISTAVGVQRGNLRPTLAVIGDMSALYDLNALSLLRQSVAPFVLVIINNEGGQIFSLLPTPESLRERYYVMPPQCEFRHAAALFTLSYQQVTDWEALFQAVQAAWQQTEAVIIEAKVSPEGGIVCFRQLIDEVSRE